MKNTNDSNGNRTRDLQACSADPQQTAQLRYLTAALSPGLTFSSPFVIRVRPIPTTVVRIRNQCNRSLRRV